MIKLLPIETLDWTNPKNFNLDNYSDNGSKGYFLEVDLDYPEELDDLHSDYPLAPKKTKSNKRKLSPISVTNHGRE